jgi:hypothetical protein
VSDIAKKLQIVLDDLKQVGSVEAAAIVSRDGLLIRVDIPSKPHAEAFGAMSATMLGAAETAMAEIGVSLPNRVIVESKHGLLIVTGAGSRGILVVLTKNDETMGLILVELEKAVKKVKEILGA